MGAQQKVRFTPEDRAFLAALLCRLPTQRLRRLRLLVRPDTILRWHRDLRLGDARACDLALSAAVTMFERRTPGDDPEWTRYFDDAELAAEFGHCLRG
jgi:hypothetical protein